MNDHQLGISRASAANALDIKVNTRRNIPFLRAAMCYLVCLLYKQWPFWLFSEDSPKILRRPYEGFWTFSQNFRSCLIVTEGCRRFSRNIRGCILVQPRVKHDISKMVNIFACEDNFNYNPSNLFAPARLVWTRYVTEYSPAKTGEYPRIFRPNFENCACCEKDLKDNKDNSLHLRWKYAWILVLGHYPFLVADSFPRASLSENCSLLGTDNVRGQISVHIFAPNGGSCLYIFITIGGYCSCVPHLVYFIKVTFIIFYLIFIIIYLFKQLLHLNGLTIFLLQSKDMIVSLFH